MPRTMAPIVRMGCMELPLLREAAPCGTLRPCPLVHRLRRTMTAPDTEARSLAAQLRFLLATREAIVAHKFSFRQSPQIYATSESFWRVSLRNRAELLIYPMTSLQRSQLEPS
jgi:hypothetical protein